MVKPNFLPQLLDRDGFRFITKIKTIGSTYMAASGVTPESNTNGYTNRKVLRRGARVLATLIPLRYTRTLHSTSECSTILRGLEGKL